MNKTVNLRQARKAKKRAEDKARADANAAAFGVPKAERAQSAEETARAAERLDAHRRETPSAGTKPDTPKS